MSDLVERARDFAVRAHDRINQLRKYSGQPYGVHLRAVAEMVAEVTDDSETLAAAWLHDTVEDTTATVQDIENRFGRGVATLVDELTDVSKPGDGNRAVRKEIDRRHLAQASPRAQTVKLADLIDNCRDICRHDPDFGRVYLAEMAALVEVLEHGDPQLVRRAHKAHRKYTEQISLKDPVGPQMEMRRELGDQMGLSFSQLRLQRLFSEAFAVKDIAEPLPSVDALRAASEVKALMEARGWLVVGVREEGTVTAWVRRQSLGDSGRCGEYARPVSAGESVAGDASLSDAIQILTRHDNCFVTVFGEVAGVVTRGDIQKPVVRMWLFGMITIVEMITSRSIRNRFPDDSWRPLVSEARLQKALALQQERARQEQQSSLLDCLQLSDKAQIVIEDQGLLGGLGFESKREGRKMIRELESLRNNLAHAQDIVSSDWAAIARITHRLEFLIAQV